MSRLLAQLGSSLINSLSRKHFNCSASSVESVSKSFANGAARPSKKDRKIALISLSRMRGEDGLVLSGEKAKSADWWSQHIR